MWCALPWNASSMPMAIPGICGNGHLPTPDTLRVDQAKRPLALSPLWPARAAEFRERHKIAA